MDSRTKIVVGMVLALVALSSAFIATPALAGANGTNNGDQVRDQERLRSRDMSCDGERLQTQEQDRLRYQNCSSYCEQVRTQNQERLGTQSQTHNAEREGYCSGRQCGTNSPWNDEGNRRQNRNRQ